MMSLALNVKVVYGLIALTCILVAAMIYMSVQMNSGLVEVTEFRWNCFKYTTWATVGVGTLLIVAAVTLIIRQALKH